VNPWEAAKARDEERARLTGKLIEAEQEELISHANREDLFRSMQIRASNQQLCEAVMRERLGHGLKPPQFDCAMTKVSNPS